MKQIHITVPDDLYNAIYQSKGALSLPMQIRIDLYNKYMRKTSLKSLTTQNE